MLWKLLILILLFNPSYGKDMRKKDTTVRTQFHPMITEFLFEVNELYRGWKDEVVITSGSEVTASHSRNSLHYATPAQAVDIRSWSYAWGRGSVPKAHEQLNAICILRDSFAERVQIPADWLEVHLETNHIHIEYQPKRQYAITGK